MFITSRFLFNAHLSGVIVTIIIIINIIVINYTYCCFNNNCYFLLLLAACNTSCYDELPANEVIYASNGDMFEITVVHTGLSTFRLAREDSGGFYNVVDDDDVCGGDTNVCVLDADAARFEINSFQSSLAGNYEYQYFYTFVDVCLTPFTLIEASEL